jgi:hypothetical protein
MLCPMGLPHYYLLLCLYCYLVYYCIPTVFLYFKSNFRLCIYTNNKKVYSSLVRIYYFKYESIVTSTTATSATSATTVKLTLLTLLLCCWLAIAFDLYINNGVHGMFVHVMFYRYCYLDRTSSSSSSLSSSL